MWSAGVPLFDSSAFRLFHSPVISDPPAFLSSDDLTLRRKSIISNGNPLHFPPSRHLTPLPAGTAKRCPLSCLKGSLPPPSPHPAFSRPPSAGYSLPCLLLASPSASPFLLALRPSANSSVSGVPSSVLGYLNIFRNLSCFVHWLFSYSTSLHIFTSC